MLKAIFDKLKSALLLTSRQLWLSSSPKRLSRDDAVNLSLASHILGMLANTFSEELLISFGGFKFKEVTRHS